MKLIFLFLMPMLSLAQKVDLPTKPFEYPEAPIARLSNAIKFKTVSSQADQNKDQFKLFLNFLKKEFPKVFQKLEVQEFGNTLLLHYTGKESTVRLFNAHYDVVGVNDLDLEKWEQPPFSGLVDQNFIWGRGTLDDKASVLAWLEVLEELVADNFVPQSHLYFAITHDEEVGGWDGAAKVAEFLKNLNLAVTSVMDEGLVIVENSIKMVDKPIAMIGISEKGYVSLKVTATGKGGHSSIPRPGSATWTLLEALEKLQPSPFESRLTLPVLMMLKNLAPYTTGITPFLLSYPEVFGFAIKSQLEKTPEANAIISTTQALTMLTAGIQDNKIPNTASAVLNYRILPGDTVKTVFETVEKIIKVENIRVEIINPSDANDPGPIASTENEFFKDLKTLIGQHFPDTVFAPAIMLARTDSYHYQKLTNNIYRFQPVRLNSEDTGRIHGLNERISKENYFKMIKFYQALLKKL